MDKRIFVVDRSLEMVMIRALRKYQQQLQEQMENPDAFILTKIILRDEINDVEQALEQIFATATDCVVVDDRLQIIEKKDWLTRLKERFTRKKPSSGKLDDQ